MNDSARVGRTPAVDEGKQSNLLISLAETAELFHAPDGQTYATIRLENHCETHAIHRKGFRQFLTREFYKARGSAPGSQSMQDALGFLDARARFDGPEISTYLRIGESEGAVFVDLGDESWRVVRITAQGWEIRSNGGCKFRRAPAMRPLPTPIRGGQIRNLRPFLNVAATSDFHLAVGALFAAFNPRGPYPIVNYQGEQGSAKTTTARVCRELCDPSVIPVRTMPRDERDLHIAASNSWMLTFDNVSRVSPMMSDALCRLSTGGGFATRQLHTDQDEVLIDVTRPVALTGIEDLMERDDLRDRSVILTLPPISDRERRDERTFWAAFHQQRAHLLGALFDGVARAMRDLGKASLAELPRMADLARWVTAGETSFGWSPGTFLRAYREHGKVAARELLAGDRFAVAITENVQEFCGTSAQLLEILNGFVVRKDRGPDWPMNPRATSGRLRRLAPALKRDEYDVTFDGPRRIISIKRTERETTVPTGGTVPPHGR